MLLDCWLVGGGRREEEGGIESFQWHGAEKMCDGGKDSKKRRGWIEMGKERERERKREG